MTDLATSEDTTPIWQPPERNVDAPYSEKVKMAGIGPGRHLVSVVVALVAVPLGYLSLDYALHRGLNTFMSTGTGHAPVTAIVFLAVACTLFLVAAGTGRVAALGPILAAAVWGAVPAVVAFVHPRTLLQVVEHLPNAYSQIGDAVVFYGPFLFPMTATLLLGAGLSGRWRRTGVPKL